MSLNRSMQFLLGLGTIAALAGAQQQAMALTSTLEVTASVPDACTLESGTLALGTYKSNQQNTVSTTGGFNVQCSSAANVHIVLDGGLHPGVAGNGRTMTSPSTSSFLNYDLFKGTGITNPWPESISYAYSLASGANPISIFGVIPGNQPVGGGEYSDTVQITLTFD